MVSFNTNIKKFSKKGEKTGWTYIEIPSDIANKLFPGNKKSFRVKGKLDDYTIKQAALMPMGKGDFILALNSDMRKGTGKKYGDELSIKIEADRSEVKLSSELLECLEEESKALEHFYKLPPSHQKYYSRWIESAKTFETKSKRIAMAVNSLLKGYHYGEMIRESQGKPIK